MKASLSISVCSLVLFISIPTLASDTNQKEIRNDRISVSKSIQQFDINPFSDSKRIVRNDHIRYSHPKAETDHKDDDAETTIKKKRRYIRNDHVTIIK